MTPTDEKPVGLRVFLVEDDENIALLIRKALERAGHQVNHCPTAAAARSQLRQQPIDLVLLDNNLPDMNGLDLLNALVSDGVTAPMLMVTAHGDELLATRVLQAGALDYIVKDPALQFLAELPKRVRESVNRHQLQQLNHLLLAAVESAHEGIVITDVLGTILHVNSALERLTGYNRDELLGRDPQLLMSAAQAGDLYTAVRQSILAHPSWQGEIVIRRKEGGPLDVSLGVSPILDGQGQVTHFVGMLRDMTERKHLQRQLMQAQKMQGIGTLAGGIAHEFNNLLAGISGYATLGQREAPAEGPLPQFLEHIVSLSERAADLTRQLLLFARPPHVSRRSLSMEELVRTSAELVGSSLHLAVALDVQPTADGRPLMAEADGTQLQHALMNLALNARDALVEPAPITFAVRQVVLTAEWPTFPENIPAGDYAVLEVTDTGCGMPPEVLNQALDPFYTTKEVGRGSGLGLPVVYGIVQAHQGHLTIVSTPGQGTCVGLYLPHCRD